MKISLDDIDAFIFDFDGVLTNNLVYLNQDGKEWVACSRSDGIAFDVLRKLGKPAYILSTEINPIVKARANKLKVPALQGVNDKAKTLSLLVEEQKYNLSRIMYVGNDLNDYGVMLICGFSACPADSHKKIKSISDIHLQTKGGNGVVRELLEEVLGVDFIKIFFDK
jgi:YrbI family 3-deoxy-D-manno-octulosonate 8-phosphate phosphatase